MTPEWIGVLLSAATLVVIAATAVAAIIQLRHLRASNQLTALLAILEQWGTPVLTGAYARLYSDLPAKLSDPAFRAGYAMKGSVDRTAHPEALVLDFWEQVGTYAKHGLVDEETLLDICSSQVYHAWKRAEQAIALIREANGISTCENFEYLAVKGALWMKRNEAGTYPRGVPRMSELESSLPQDLPQP